MKRLACRISRIFPALFFLLRGSAGSPAFATGLAESARERYLHPLNFRLLDQTGRMQLLSHFASRKAILLVGWSTACASSGAVVSEMGALEERYGSEELAILGIDPETADTQLSVAEKIGSHPTVLLDSLQMVAPSFQIKSVGEFALLDAGTLELLGRGNLLQGRNVLRTRLDGLLALRGGMGVSLWRRFRELFSPEVVAGSSCTFRRMNSAAEVPRREVLERFQRACNRCHMRSPETDYFKTVADIRAWSSMIRRELRMKEMPLGVLDDTYGNFSKPFGQKNLAIIHGWLENSSPSRDEEPAFAKLRAVATKEMALKPDYVFRMEKADVIPARGEVAYRYYQVAGPMKEDLWVESYSESMNFAVVHHADVIVSPVPLDSTKWVSGAGGMMRVSKLTKLKNSNALKIQEEHFITGPFHTKLPGRLAYFIPKDSYLILEVHYQPTGKVETNQGSVSLFKYKGSEPPLPLLTRGFYREKFTIPPHVPEFTLTDSYNVDDDMTVFMMQAHMHLRGVSYRVRMLAPDGTSSVIFSLPFHNFLVNLGGELEKPLFVPRGSKLFLESVFDNSADNPRNPDPAASVPVGPQTETNEMSEFRVFYYPGSM
jgi:hypothetical protein